MEKPKNVFEWIEDLMEETGCDYETAARAWELAPRPEDYDPEDYE